MQPLQVIMGMSGHKRAQEFAKRAAERLVNYRKDYPDCTADLMIDLIIETALCEIFAKHHQVWLDAFAHDKECFKKLSKAFAARNKGL